MIVKMTILRLLGSSDDKEKEKIGVARPEGLPLRGFRYPDSGRGSCSNPCNERCNENVVVESCDDLIAKENDELNQEVERLMKDLYRLKGKGMESNVQPSQDNRKN